MAASNATPGYGAVLKRGATTIAEVVSITGPGVSRDTIEKTHLTSDGMAREFIPGLIDGGDVTVELNFLPDDTTQALIFSDMISTTVTSVEQAYTIQLTDATPQTIAMNLIPTAWEPSAPFDDKLSLSVTFKVSGAVAIG
ncbi:MAG: phage tail tube protein [Actinomycetota bacterium]|nr:phage tail tube protein [Actinomycetota bacterium]